MIVFSHPTGNANVRAALTGLYDAGLLQRFYTTIATYPGNAFDRLSKIGPLGEFQRRGYPPRLESITRVRPWKELARIAAKKGNLEGLVKHEHGIFSVDAIYHDLDSYVANQLRGTDARAVYAYEDGALDSFKAARRAGLTRLYDLPIGYWRSARQLLQEVVEDRPEWAMTIAGMKDSQPKLERKDQELATADHIFVASTFTKTSLEAYPGELPEIDVIPYGFPEPFTGRQFEPARGRPLKLLFVGGLSQRKGIAEMFEAVAALGGRVSLTVVGRKPGGVSCPALDEALARHRYIESLPHGEILSLMREHDLFLFPSHFEGFGLVITEAMSQGTPAICTDRTAGPDLITHGKDGYIIPAGSTEALRNQIEEILAKPDAIAEAGRAAIDRAGRRPWSAYGKELSQAVARVVSPVNQT